MLAANLFATIGFEGVLRDALAFMLARQIRQLKVQATQWWIASGRGACYEA
jgi:hypothetical protein